jgi:hypothetical protein
MATSPDATYQRSGWQLDSVVSELIYRAAVFVPPSHIVKWMCWRSNMFALSSARNLVRRPQQATAIIQINSIELVQDIWVVFPIKKWLHIHRWWSTHRPAINGEEGPVHHKFLPQWQDHESDCLHNHSAVPSRCSSLETASQMVFRYLASAPRQCAVPRSPECQGILGLAQHPW